MVRLMSVCRCPDRHLDETGPAPVGQVALLKAVRNILLVENRSLETVVRPMQLAIYLSR